MNSKKKQLLAIVVSLTVISAWSYLSAQITVSWVTIIPDPTTMIGDVYYFGDRPIGEKPVPPPPEVQRAILISTGLVLIVIVIYLMYPKATSLRPEMMMISKEEFVKRKITKCGEWSKDLEEALFAYYEDIVDVNCVLLDREGWLRIKTLIDFRDGKLPFNNAEDNLVWLLGRFEELRKAME